MNLYPYLAWKEGAIVFDDIPITEAIEILERWFNVTIEMKSKSTVDCYISNTYRNENLMNILKSITFIKSGLAYEFQDRNKILITGTCNPNTL